MNRSDSIDKLAPALVLAQQEIEAAVKASDNPFFHSKYADLEATWKACREALVKRDLAVIQLGAVPSDPKKVALETILLHASGQWISNTFEMPIVKFDPQAAGSAVTYMRRYMLQAALGIVAVDDDGEGATDRGNNTGNGSKKSNLDKLFALIKTLKLPQAEIKATLDQYGAKGSQDLTEADIKDWTDELQRRISKQREEATASA